MRERGERAEECRTVGVWERELWYVGEEGKRKELGAESASKASSQVFFFSLVSFFGRTNLSADKLTCLCSAHLFNSSQVQEATSRSLLCPCSRPSLLREPLPSFGKGSNSNIIL